MGYLPNDQMNFQFWISTEVQNFQIHNWTNESTSKILEETRQRTQARVLKSNSWNKKITTLIFCCKGAGTYEELQLKKRTLFTSIQLNGPIKTSSDTNHSMNVAASFSNTSNAIYRLWNWLKAFVLCRFKRKWSITY